MPELVRIGLRPNQKLLSLLYGPENRHDGQEVVGAKLAIEVDLPLLRRVQSHVRDPSGEAGEEENDRRVGIGERYLLDGRREVMTYMCVVLNHKKMFGITRNVTQALLVPSPGVREIACVLDYLRRKTKILDQYGPEMRSGRMRLDARYDWHAGIEGNRLHTAA